MNGGEASPVAGAAPERSAGYAGERYTGIRTRVATTLTVFAALTITVCALAPLAGSTPISLARALDRSIPFAENVDAQVLFIARLPR